MQGTIKLDISFSCLERDNERALVNKFVHFRVTSVLISCIKSPSITENHPPDGWHLAF